MEPETPPAYRPLSGTERSWYKAVPTGTGITVIALLLARPIPVQDLQAALRSLLRSHPILDSALSPSSLLPSPSPLLLLTSPLPPRVHATHHMCPLLSVLELELNLNPWSDSHPPPVPNLFATLYGSTVLALRLHTAVCDRVSVSSILEELPSLIAGGGTDEKGVVGLGMEELIRKEDAWKPLWARGRDLVGYSLNGLRSAAPPFEDAASSRSSEVVRTVMEKADTDALLNQCKANGVKLCAALAAAALIAIYASKNLDRPETYSVVTLVNCRRSLHPAPADRDVGFYHSAVTNAHAVQGGEGVWELAARCHAACSDAKGGKKHLTDIGDLNFLMCKAIDNPQLTPSSSLRTAAVSVFEEPAVHESAGLREALGVEDYVACASVHGVGPSIAVFDTIRDGRLDCAFVYPSPLHSRRQVGELAEHMKRILVEGSNNVQGAKGMA